MWLKIHRDSTHTTFTPKHSSSSSLIVTLYLSNIQNNLVSKPRDLIGLDDVTMELAHQGWHQQAHTCVRDRRCKGLVHMDLSWFVIIFTKKIYHSKGFLWKNKNPISQSICSIQLRSFFSVWFHIDGSFFTAKSKGKDLLWFGWVFEAWCLIYYPNVVVGLGFLYNGFNFVYYTSP